MAIRHTPHDYEVIMHRDDVATLRFSGHFDGRTVIWEAHIERLADAAAVQFIEIDAPLPLVESTLCKARIGLRVPCIDTATLLKTVIMMRQYKRLRRGRHEFRPG